MSKRYYRWLLVRKMFDRVKWPRMNSGRKWCHYKKNKEENATFNWGYMHRCEMQHSGEEKAFYFQKSEQKTCKHLISTILIGIGNHIKHRFDEFSVTCIEFLNIQLWGWETCLSLILLLLRCSVAECLERGVLGFWSIVFASTFTVPVKLECIINCRQLGDKVLFWWENKPLVWGDGSFLMVNSSSSSSSSSSSWSFLADDVIISMKLWFFWDDDGLRKNNRVQNDMRYWWQ